MHNQLKVVKGHSDKAIRFQRAIADFIKRHRTIKLLHVLRGYSALVVVISSSILVAATNVAAGKDTGGFLLDLDGNDDEKMLAASVTPPAEAEEENLVFVPIAQANSADNSDKNDSSIIAELGGEEGMMSFSAAPAGAREPGDEEDVQIYEVQSGDTISTIAQEHGITTNTILWANDLDHPDEIMPGDKIFILPVAGLSHIVKSGESLDKIAKDYKADKDKIIAFNDLPANGEIEKGQTIIIPDGEKDLPTYASDTSTFARRNYATPSGGSPQVSGWRKLEGKAGTGHRFPYGYCTWYVSQRRYVPWGGHAGTWLYSAKARGYKTGKKPKSGAIMVTTEDRYYGHVALVEKVHSDGTITVSEMNYKGWGIKNSRRLSAKSRAIKGFIY